MKLAQTALRPSYQREPCFDGIDLKESSCELTCAKCSTAIVISSFNIYQGAWGWEKSFAQDEIEEIRSFFDLSIVGKVVKVS